MKKGVLLLILLLVPIVNAEISVTIKEKQSTFLPLGQANFELILSTSLSFESVRLDYSEDFWRAKYNPGFLDLTSNKEFSTKLEIFPLSLARPGEHIFTVIVYSTKDNSVLKEFPLRLTYVNPKQAIGINLLADKIDSEKEQSLVQVKLINNYDITYNNLDVKLSNSFINERRTINLEPLEEKVVDFLVSAQGILVDEYPVSIELFYNNEEFDEESSTILVSSVSSLKEDVSSSSSIFSNIKHVTIVNNGNFAETGKYSLRITPLERIFTFTNIKPSNKIKTEQGYIYEWTYNLKPGQSFILDIKTPYNSFISVFLILLILLIAWYYIFGHEIKVNKKVLHIAGEHHGINNVKIMLKIKNNSIRHIENFKAVDKLPHYIMPRRETFSPFQPSSIRRGNKGMIIIWDIPHIAPKEERLMSYIVESKFPILGRMTLPGAYVTYRNNKGRKVKSYSNKLIMFSIPDF